MIEFNCSACETRLRVNGALGGRKVRCPKCRDVISVPKQETTTRRRMAPRTCQRCNRPVLPNEMTQEIEGKVHCSYCLTDLGIASSGGLHDPTTLNIPGMVVLRGKEERDAARRFLDTQAEKQHSESDDAES
ncbi:MAG: hypothetical protein O7H41_11055 [Planctomycetota bacterium]|nr:hypothetical protein [Planctomycetota bacterium]